MPHLFDRFYRANTSSSGLGLGLYISRILVEAHGGRIRVESRPGQGSTYTIGLPRDGKTVSDKQADYLQPIANGQKPITNYR